MLNNLLDHKLKFFISQKKHAEQKAYVFLFRTTCQCGRRTKKEKGCTLLMAFKLG